MDPNATLRELRELAEDFLGDDESPGAGDVYAMRIDCLRMAELFQALDEWIGGGGFLPQAWLKGGWKAK